DRCSIRDRGHRNWTLFKYYRKHGISFGTLFTQSNAYVSHVSTHTGRYESLT
ncbi:hypothetical protein WH47_10483, partial [Habropoda laboriosa]